MNRPPQGQPTHSKYHTLKNDSIGLRAVFLNHQRTGKGDLWSLHSWLGIAVITLFVGNVRANASFKVLTHSNSPPTSTPLPSPTTYTQWVVGVLAFFLQVASEPVRAAVLPQHAFLGTMLYLAAIFTVRGSYKYKGSRHCRLSMIIVDGV